MTREEFDKLPEEIRDALEIYHWRIDLIETLEWARDPLGLPFVGRIELKGEER